MPKERTKGQKEIYLANKATINFYFNITAFALIAQLCHIAVSTWWNLSLSPWSIFWTLFSIAHHAGAHWMLRFISRATISTKGEVIDAGTDLLNSWVSEYSKDVIIFIAILQCLSAISNMFWILWFVVPGFAFYKVWVMFLWPWFKAGSEPVDESLTGGRKSKKQKVKYSKY